MAVLDKETSEHRTLRSEAIAAIIATDPEEKAERTEHLACAWFDTPFLPVLKRRQFILKNATENVKISQNDGLVRLA